MMDFTQWVTDIGMTEQMLLMLLYIPVIVTLINFTRYVVGFKTLGIYAPMVLAYAYIFTGIRFGLLITAAVIAGTLITYSIFKKVRMHYISRISVNYILVTFFIIFVIAFNEISPFPITTENHNVATIPPLGVILIVTLSDFFIKQYVKKDLGSSLRAVAETVVIGIAGWALLRLPFLQVFILDNLWLQPILLGVNIALGKYTGVRFKELFRFQRVIKDE
ncbi:MAG: 7TM domain-containing protein [Candidatus Dojkabacteria bacterium]|nr:MAG: 7TM domain-containing protein [Candidatus Dojkabacteria bacterium]